MRPALTIGLLALTFAAAAALFDAEQLWVPTVALGALAAGTAGWVLLAARGLRVRRTLGARQVMEDEPLQIVFDVTAGLLPLPSGHIVDPLLPARALLPGGRRSGRVRIEVRFGRRGRRRLEPPRVLVADPLGLAHREVGAERPGVDEEILVLPRLEPVLFAMGAEDPAQVLRRGPRSVGAEVELDGIRPLREGTPASRIFWPAVARGAEAQERRLSAAGASDPLVVLDPRRAASEADLDAAVRAAASLAHQLAVSGGCDVLLPGERRATAVGPTLAGWAHVHARLALVQDAAGPVLSAAGHRRGPVVFVSARIRSRLPPALAPAAATAPRLLVMPGDLPVGRPALSVAGCRGYLLTPSRPRAARRRGTGIRGAA